MTVGLGWTDLCSQLPPLQVHQLCCADLSSETCVSVMCKICKFDCLVWKIYFPEHLPSISHECIWFLQLPGQVLLLLPLQDGWPQPQALRPQEWWELWRRHNQWWSLVLCGQRLASIILLTRFALTGRCSHVQYCYKWCQQYLFIFFSFFKENSNDNKREREKTTTTFCTLMKMPNNNVALW